MLGTTQGIRTANTPTAIFINHLLAAMQIPMRPPKPVVVKKIWLNLFTKIFLIDYKLSGSQKSILLRIEEGSLMLPHVNHFIYKSETIPNKTLSKRISF